MHAERHTLGVNEDETQCRSWDGRLHRASVTETEIRESPYPRTLAAAYPGMLAAA